MNNKFRTSNIDFVAYLKMNGIEFTNTEKSKNNNKIMFGYDYDFKTLIDMQNHFNNDEVLIKMQEFRNARGIILDIVKLI